MGMALALFPAIDASKALNRRLNPFRRADRRLLATSLVVRAFCIVAVLPSVVAVPFLQLGYVNGTVASGLQALPVFPVLVVQAIAAALTLVAAAVFAVLDRTSSNDVGTAPT